MNGKPSLSVTPTVGHCNYSKSFQLSDGGYIDCLIYDTGGQERYRSIIDSYYKKADAVLLVYDISSKQSFEDIQNFYVDKIRESCKEDITILLLGNKTDLEFKREVPKDLAIALAEKENYSFAESSCAKNDNVAGAFEALVQRWYIDKRKKIEQLKIENLKEKKLIKKEKLKEEKKVKDKNKILIRSSSEYNFRINFTEKDHSLIDESEIQRGRGQSFRLKYEPFKKEEKESSCCLSSKNKHHG